MRDKRRAQELAIEAQKIQNFLIENEQESACIYRDGSRWAATVIWDNKTIYGNGETISEAIVTCEENLKNVISYIAPVAPVIERTWARVTSIAENAGLFNIALEENTELRFPIHCDTNKWAIYGEEIKESYANNTFITIDYGIDKDGYKFLIGVVPF